MKDTTDNGFREVKTDGGVRGMTLGDFCLVYYRGTWSYISPFHVTLVVLLI